MNTFRMEDEESGLSTTIEYDSDGFPTVRIHTPDGSFADENGRPTVEVTLNGETLHTMFEEQETGWWE